jgi:hypothetical protein
MDDAEAAALLASSVGSPAKGKAFQRLMAANFREMLVMGSVFVKHGRRGSPHNRYVWVDGDLLAVHWRAVGGSTFASGESRGTMLVSSIHDVQPGRESAVFARSRASRPGRDDACFTIVADDRTLDLEVEWIGSGHHAGAGGGSGAGAATAVHVQERAARDRWVAAFQWLVSTAAERVRATAGAAPDGGAAVARGAAAPSGSAARPPPRTALSAGALHTLASAEGGAAGHHSSVGRFAASLGRLVRSAASSATSNASEDARA